MDGPGEYYVQRNESEKNKYCLFTYMWNPKNKTMNITKTGHRYREQTSGYQWAEEGEGKYRSGRLEDTNYWV